MNSVLISIRPNWCELIELGMKTIEIRKSKPNIKTPFRVYIYETKNNDMIFAGEKIIKLPFGRGKIIGEFICDKIENIEIRHFSVLGHENVYTSVGLDADNQWLVHSCLSYNEVAEYGKGAALFGWHISKLKIYEKPVSVTSMYVCEEHRKEGENFGYGIRKLINQPPRSWCYVAGIVKCKFISEVKKGT